MIRSLRNQLSPRTPINPRQLLKIFAWISIGALSALVFSKALLPLLGGAALPDATDTAGQLLDVRWHRPPMTFCAWPWRRLHDRVAYEIRHT